MPALQKRALSSRVGIAHHNKVYSTSIDNGKTYMNACEIASSLGQLLAITIGGVIISLTPMGQGDY